MQDYFREKRLLEERGEIVESQEKILSKAVAEGRDLTKSEKKEVSTLEAEFQKYTALLEAEGYENDQLKGRVPVFSGSNGAGLALSGDKKLKVYASNESVMQPRGSDDLDLNNYLKGVVTKPGSDHERSVIQASLGSDGYTLPTSVTRELIDRLRARNPLIKAGARSIMLETSDTKMVRITSDPTAEWKEELSEQDFSDPSFDAVTFAPKTVRAIVQVGRELLQDSQNVGEALSAAFIGSLNQAILSASFTGSGPHTPEGLLTQIALEETYDEGGDPDWSHFVKANKKLHDVNVPSEGRAHVMAPSVWEDLALQVDSQNRFQNAPEFIADIPSYTSSGCPTGVAYAGAFDQVVYGYRLDIRLEQHQGLGVRKYASTWLAVARLDMQVLRPAASLCRIREYVS